MPLFGKSQKSPAELVKALKEAVNSLERGDKKAEKAQEDVSKNLVSSFISHRKLCETFRTCLTSSIDLKHLMFSLHSNAFQSKFIG